SSGEDHAATVKFGGYFCVMFSEILLYCWFGHNVIEKNEEVCLAAYSCSWYDGSKEFKNRILFIILRTQKTLAFHGGVFYTFSRATFLSQRVVKKVEKETELFHNVLTTFWNTFLYISLTGLSKYLPIFCILLLAL
ncbi:Odorant receptor coreceptor, partial [Gryllus bimaculatus]